MSLACSAWAAPSEVAATVHDTSRYPKNSSPVTITPATHAPAGRGTGRRGGTRFRSGFPLSRPWALSSLPGWLRSDFREAPAVPHVTTAPPVSIVSLAGAAILATVLAGDVTTPPS